MASLMPKWIRTEKRYALYDRDDFTCQYCGCRVIPGIHGKDGSRAATLDHIIPREHGGSNHETNLITACWTCNSARKAKALAAWLQYIGAAEGVAARIYAAVKRPFDRKKGARLYARRYELQALYG